MDDKDSDNCWGRLCADLDLPRPCMDKGGTVGFAPLYRRTERGSGKWSNLPKRRGRVEIWTQDSLTPLGSGVINHLAQWSPIRKWHFPGWEKEGKPLSGIKKWGVTSVCWLILSTKMTMSQRCKPAHGLSSREPLGVPPPGNCNWDISISVFFQEMLRTSLSLHVFGCKTEILLPSRVPVRMSWEQARKAPAWYFTPALPAPRRRLVSFLISSLLSTHLKTTGPSTEKWFLREGPLLVSRHPTHIVGKTSQGHIGLSETKLNDSNSTCNWNLW